MLVAVISLTVHYTASPCELAFYLTHFPLLSYTCHQLFTEVFKNGNISIEGGRLLSRWQTRV